MAEAVAPFVLGVLTRGRPEWARRCVTSALATAGTEQLRVVVMFDEDYTGYDMFPAYPGVIKGVIGPRHYYCAGMNELYDAMKTECEQMGCTLDYFAVANDDVEFLSPQWPMKIQQFLDATFPDGEGIAEFVGLDKCAHYATRAAFIDREFDGKLAAPGYVMYFSDSEMMRRAKALDRYRFVTEKGVRVPVAIHYETWDDLRHEAKSWFQHDKTLYESRFPKETA